MMYWQPINSWDETSIENLRGEMSLALLPSLPMFSDIPKPSCPETTAVAYCEKKMQVTLEQEVFCSVRNQQYCD